MALTTTALCKTEMGITESTDDTLIGTYITEATGFINTYCRRTFEAATATRYYTQSAVRGQRLYLDDDLLTITTLTNGNTSTVASTEYRLHPRNEGPPYHWIELKSSSVWNFNTDGEISVAGTWGWSTTVPDAIARACKKLVVWMYRLRPGSTGGSSVLFTADGVAVMPSSLPKDITETLIKFRAPTRLIP